MKETLLKKPKDGSPYFAFVKWWFKQYWFSTDPWEGTWEEFIEYWNEFTRIGGEAFQLLNKLVFFFFAILLIVCLPVTVWFLALLNKMAHVWAPESEEEDDRYKPNPKKKD